MQNFAILIDGGFARRKLGSAKRPADTEDIVHLIRTIQDAKPLKEMRLHRVFYYDASPLESSHTKPLNGGDFAFGESDLAKRSNKLFDSLVRQPHVAMRLGELTFQGWVVNQRKLDKAKNDTIEITANDLQPKITQKGVDMRIGMDIAALTLKKQAQVIVLVSGDSDLVPAMKFARREGANLYLVHFGHHIRDAMYEHSDLVLDVAPKADQ